MAAPPRLTTAQLAALLRRIPEAAVAERQEVEPPPIIDWPPAADLAGALAESLPLEAPADEPIGEIEGTTTTPPSPTLEQMVAKLKAAHLTVEGEVVVEEAPPATDEKPAEPPALTLEQMVADLEALGLSRAEGEDAIVVDETTTEDVATEDGDENPPEAEAPLAVNDGENNPIPDAAPDAIDTLPDPPPGPTIEQMVAALKAAHLGGEDIVTVDEAPTEDVATEARDENPPEAKVPLAVNDGENDPIPDAAPDAIDTLPDPPPGPTIEQMVAALKAAHLGGEDIVTVDEAPTEDVATDAGPKDDAVSAPDIDAAEAIEEVSGEKAAAPPAGGGREAALAALLGDPPPSDDFAALDLLATCWPRETTGIVDAELLAVARNLATRFGRPDKLPMATVRAWRMLDAHTHQRELAALLRDILAFIGHWRRTEDNFLILDFGEIELIELAFESLHPGFHQDEMVEVMDIKALSNRRLGLLRRMPIRMRRLAQEMAAAGRKEEALVELAHAKALLTRIIDPLGYPPIVEAAQRAAQDMDKLMQQVAGTGAPPPPQPPAGGVPLGRIGG